MDELTLAADAALTPSSQFLPEPLVATFTERRSARHFTDQPTKPQKAAMIKKTNPGAKCGTSRTIHPIMILIAPKPTAQIIARRNECAKTPESRPPTPAISSDIAKKITIPLKGLAFRERSYDTFQEPQNIRSGKKAQYTADCSKNYKPLRPTKGTNNSCSSAKIAADQCA